MTELPAPTPTPRRIHARAAALIGYDPAWMWTRYRGGLYRMDHYRRCSWCGCIHPGDLMALLRSGRSSLKHCGRTMKRILLTPNPLAGRPCRMGTEPGPVFGREHPPLSLMRRLVEPPEDSQLVPTMDERLTGHFERQAFGIGPEMISQPFYLDHTTDQQWDEIIAAMAIGERKQQHAATLQGS